jgi:hypothetical protein
MWPYNILPILHHHPVAREQTGSKEPAWETVLGLRKSRRSLLQHGVPKFLQGHMPESANSKPPLSACPRLRAEPRAGGSSEDCSPPPGQGLPAVGGYSEVGTGLQSGSCG